MKLLLKLLTPVCLIALIVISCQKTLSDKPSTTFNSNSEFGSAFVKQWYYSKFKQTKEWGTSNEKGVKLPDWKTPIKIKIGQWDAIEYPLVKSKSGFSMARDNSLTASQYKSIANASLSKIVFIKVNDNKIVVREVDYVPDWKYLNSKKFDISEIKSIKLKNDFSGRLVIKDWSGSITSTKIFLNGKAIKSTRKLNSFNKPEEQSESLEDCSTVEVCRWQQDCLITIENDVITAEECGEWYNTGDCWTEEYCMEDDGDDCENYGIGCGGGDGGGGGDEEPNACNMTESEAANILGGVMLTGFNGEANSISGAETGPDQNGVYKKPKNTEGGGVTVRLIANIHLKYRSKFTGVVYKNSITDNWKWESIEYSSFPLVEGTIPPCFSVSATAVVSVAIAPNKLSASSSGNCTITPTISCLGGYQQTPFSGTFSATHLPTE